MALLKINQSKSMKKAGLDHELVPIMDRWVEATLTLSLSATSRQSTALTSGINYIRLTSDVDCYYEIGVDPTATTASSRYLPAKVVIYEYATGGEKVSAITK